MAQLLGTEGFASVSCSLLREARNPVFLDVLECSSTRDSSRSKALAVLNRSNKGLNHLSIDKVAVELVELSEPKIVALEVVVWCIVRIPSQIPEVLHQHEGAVEMRARELLIFSHCPQDLRASLRASRQFLYQLITLRAGERSTRIRVERINILRAGHRRRISGYEVRALDELVEVSRLVRFKLLLPSGCENNDALRDALHIRNKL